MVTVAQLVESLTVTQVVAGSSPVSHPTFHVQAPLFYQVPFANPISGFRASQALSLLAVTFVTVLQTAVKLVLKPFIGAVQQSHDFHQMLVVLATTP
jgi:hypothetical protein